MTPLLLYPLLTRFWVLVQFTRFWVLVSGPIFHFSFLLSSVCEKLSESESESDNILCRLYKSCVTLQFTVYSSTRSLLVTVIYIVP